MMNRALQLAHVLLIPFFAVLLSGCYSIQARYSYDTNTDFGGLKTYAWTAGVGSAFFLAASAQHYQNAMDAQLESKGFERVEEDPDFTIRTHKVDTYREQYRTGGGYIDFPKSMIRIDFVDSKTGAVIWEGAAEAYVTERSSEKQIQKTIHDAVRDLLKEFPPSGRD